MTDSLPMSMFRAKERIKSLQEEQERAQAAQAQQAASAANTEEIALDDDDE